jgi:hypothetical protein
MSSDFANIPALQQQAPDNKSGASLRKVHHQKYTEIRSGNPTALLKYVKDPDPLVRKAVAMTGVIKFVSMLVHDPEAIVRIAVAKNADRNLASMLTKDPNDTVKKYAAQKLQGTS